MSEERFDRLEALITNLTDRVGTLTSRVDTLTEHVDTLTEHVDTMQEDITNIRGQVDTVQEDITNIRVRIDAEGTMTDTFERYFLQIMEQGNQTAQITLDNNRDIGDIQERVDRIERQQRRMNSRLNNIDR
jgi:chaperonin cofactor prefoldin